VLRAAGARSPERVALGIAALAGLLTLYNAAAYPSGAGIDAPSHTAYADFLVHHFRLPLRADTPEYYSPPLYYGAAGALSWIGRQVGLGDPYKLGQLLNVPLVVGAVLLVAALARLLWPERRWLAPAAAAFVVFSPVLVRTAAMFHPEPADLFFSVLCAYLAARMLVRRRYDARSALGLGVALGAAQMVRQFELYTLAVVALAWLVALWVRLSERRPLLRGGLIALAACVVIAGPWYGYRTVHYANPVFDRPHSSKPLFERRPGRFYTELAAGTVFSRPYRPHMTNLAWPVTYTDLWGDWYGVFDWSITQQGAPSRAHTDWLVAQNAIGILPTAIAIGGWLALLATGLRRRSPSRLLVALMPLAALAGYFYFAIGYPTPDGDVLKPMFMLSALWAWALCFAWAAVRLPRPAILALCGLAALELPFLVYTGAAGLY
jgi:Dolichyl-phosphate-mannose-protein mannosyltransferase